MIFPLRALTSQLLLKKQPNKNIIASIEDAIKDFVIEEADTIAAKINLPLQISKPLKNDPSKDERKDLKELQSNKIIIALQADKGRSTVILNREDYMQ